MISPAHLLHASNTSALLDQLRDAPRIAIDTEFHTERTWLPELFLVQLAFEDGTSWVVDPLDEPTFQAVGAAIAAVPTWVVHGGVQDLRVLSVALGRVADQVFDTQIAAALVTDQHPVGLGRLIQSMLGETLPKRATLSDWSRRPLSADQLRYAADDVTRLLPLWDHLDHLAAARGRCEILRGACAEARTEALRLLGPGELLRDMGGTWHDPREAHLVAALLAWREELGQRENRPSRSLVGDQTLRQIARLAPRHLDDFHDLRRVPRGFVKTHGEAALGVIRRALDDGPDRWPRVVVPGTPAAGRALAMRLTLEAAGYLDQYAAAFVVPGSLREALVLEPDPDAAPHLLTEWRARLAGGWITQALTGSVTVSIRHGSIVALEDPPQGK
jgi:ribonuclease D